LPIGGKREAFSFLPCSGRKDAGSPSWPEKSGSKEEGKEGMRRRCSYFNKEKTREGGTFLPSFSRLRNGPPFLNSFGAPEEKMEITLSSIQRERGAIFLALKGEEGWL